MKNQTRREFLATGAAAAALGALAGCNNAATNAEGKLPKEDSYPITPEELGSGKPKWSEEEKDGYNLVTQDGGETLSYSPESGLKLIQVDGYVFKDLNDNGKLDLFEDWRQPDDVRAAAWAQELSVDAELPLMLHASAMSANPNDIADMGPMSAGPLLDMGIHTVLNFSTSGDGHSQAKWNNAVQAYSESLPNRLPFNLSTNPRDFGGFPGNLALAASFDPELAKSVAKDLSKCYRAVGVTCLLGPQIDMCGEPRWSRITGAFGEDPALSRDMTRASVDGYQSTYDADGKDQGWGADSLGTQIKHFPGDGAGESGREAHSATGKYNVYPGDNLDASLVNFIDGGLNLDDSTKQASGVMTSYSIAYSDDGEYGEPVGSAYSKYKVDILREKCGYDGLICSDWAVTSDPEDYMHTNWGVENLTKAERYEKIIETGLDQVGGGSELDALLEGYSQYAEKVGKEAAEERVRESACRILLTYLLPGLVENPYTDPKAATKLLEGDDVAKAGREAAQKGVVLLKNEGEVIKSRSEKPKVYVPVKFTPAVAATGAGNVASGAKMEKPLSAKGVEELLDVVSDTVSEPSGPAGEDGKATYQDSDLVRATADQVADCDFAVVFVDSPSTGSGAVTAEDGTVTYVPISLQYRPYTADGANVRRESIAGDTLADGTKENRAYFGQSCSASNESDLDCILDTVKLMAGKPVVVVVNESNPTIFSEFEDQVQGLMVHFGASDLALADIISGKVEPSGLLPLQQPANMDTVEANCEDVCRDLDCYVDAAGNTYDFGFGLNWKGVIDDERVKTYAQAAPLTKPEKVTL